jgi:phosphoribosylformylglycinamidine synthase
VVSTEAADAADAERIVREMCERLLANPVTEDFEIAGVEAER